MFHADALELLLSMSSYRAYCRDQAVECGRRARLAASPEVERHFEQLALHWLKLAPPRRPARRASAKPTLWLILKQMRAWWRSVRPVADGLDHHKGSGLIRFSFAQGASR